MPLPEGYRKALRLMKQAEKFHRPIVCFVDTPGAFCGMEAEERGQGEAIAKNLFELSDLKTPILSILIGEGGSGGALALAVADEVWMMENAVYSILSPEGFASILWKDAKLAQNAAKVMKLTSYDLYEAGFVEDIILEPEEYTIDSMLDICSELEEKIEAFLVRNETVSVYELIEKRYQRFRQM
jgi:acetyl-CoA carboxylase carboxyl transferase subunit beta